MKRGKCREATKGGRPPPRRSGFCKQCEQKTREVVLVKALRVTNIVYINNLYRLDFHFIPSTHFPQRGKQENSNIWCFLKLIYSPLFSRFPLSKKTMYEVCLLIKCCRRGRCPRRPVLFRPFSRFPLNKKTMYKVCLLIECCRRGRRPRRPVLFRLFSRFFIIFYPLIREPYSTTLAWHYYS